MSPEPQNVRGFSLLHDALTRAAADEEYRQQLKDDPKSALREAGLDVSDDVELVVHENEPNRVHMVIPSRAVEWDDLDADEVDIAVIFEVGF